MFYFFEFLLYPHLYNNPIFINTPRVLFLYCDVPRKFCTKFQNSRTFVIIRKCFREKLRRTSILEIFRNLLSISGAFWRHVRACSARWQRNVAREKRSFWFNINSRSRKGLPSIFSRFHAINHFFSQFFSSLMSSVILF